MSETGPARDEAEGKLRSCLAQMRLAPLDFRLRVEAGELFLALGDGPRGFRILRSCADYFTLAGFPMRALWALKLLERFSAEPALVERGLGLLARHYAQSPDARWGDPIFEMPLGAGGDLHLEELPPTLDAVMAEVDRRATDINRGVHFPDQLPRFPLLSELEAPAFLEVARAIGLRRTRAGEEIVREGETGSALHVVVTGEVTVVKRRMDGVNTTLARLGEGEFFGEMALITDSPRVASVLTSVDADLLELSRQTIESIGPAGDALRGALSRQVCDRMVNNLMKLSPVFNVVPADRRGELMSRFQSKLVEAEEDIIVEGQRGRGLYIILDGQVQVTVRRGGRRHVLNWLREGDIFGEISLIRNTVATATCTASRRTMLIFLGRDAFESIVNEFPRVGEKVHELGDFRLLDNLLTLA